MNISSHDPTGIAHQTVHQVKAVKMANDQQKLEGQMAIQLIQSAQQPVPRPDGTGQLINIVA